MRFDSLFGRVAPCGLVVAALGGCGSRSSGDAPGATAPAPTDGGTTDGAGPSDAPADGASGPADGGSPASSSEYVNGSRLRAKVYPGGAGAKIFPTWHDTMLDVDCDFTKADDGTWRCLPPRLDITYADASCTKPVYSTLSCATPPKLVASNRGECAAATILRVGAAVAPPAMTYQKSGTNCFSLGSNTSPDTTFYAVTEAVPPSAFVEGKLARERRGNLFATDVLRTADGALDAHRIYSAARSFLCNAGPLMADSPASCTPSALAFVEQYFADSACTTAAAYSPPGFCGEPPAAIVTETPPASACDHYTDSYAEVGAHVATPIYRGSASSCGSVPPAQIASGASFWTPGGPLPASAFPPFKSTVEGTERVKAQALAADDGSRLLATTFDDTQGKTACYPVNAADDQLRCLPSVEFQSIVFKDPACTQPIASAIHGCAPPLPLLRTFEPRPLCKPPRTHLYSVGALSAVTSVYGINGARCVAQPVAPGTDLYDATEIAPTDLAPMTLTQE